MVPENHLNFVRLTRHIQELRLKAVPKPETLLVYSERHPWPTLTDEGLTFQQEVLRSNPDQIDKVSYDAQQR